MSLHSGTVPIAVAFTKLSAPAERIIAGARRDHFAIKVQPKSRKRFDSCLQTARHDASQRIPYRDEQAGSLAKRDCEEDNLCVPNPITYR